MAFFLPTLYDKVIIQKWKWGLSRFKQIGIAKQQEL